MFYPVKKWPYFAVIDPRTGEKLGEWHETEPKAVADILNGFLGDHAITPAEANGLPPKRPRPSSPEQGKSCSVIDLSEDSQLEAAIKASLAENHVSVKAEDVLDSDSEVETFSDTDNESRSSFPSPCKSKVPASTEPSSSGVTDNGVAKRNLSEALGSGEEACARGPAVKNDSWKQFLGDGKDPETKLLLRLPDGQKIHVSMPCSSQVQVCTSNLRFYGELLSLLYYSFTFFTGCDQLR